MRFAVLVALVAGCGRIGFGPTGDGGAGDGGDDAPGGGGGDGAMTDAAPISSMCGTTVIIDDSFTTGGTAGWMLVNTGSFNTAKINGVQRFSVNANATAGTRAAYQQTMSNDLTNTCIIAELSQASSAAMLRSYLRIGAPAKNLEIYIEAGQLWGRFTTSGGGTTGTIGPRAYNATQMRFLRIRWVAGNYQFEYGADLQSWTAFGQQGGTLVDPSPTFVEFGALAAANQTVASTVEFERILMLGP
ncbi:MAG: hypothetical protein JNL83_34965 [Myxococcales bacterium]|nr:hypothetical protein [Myxococcales bacterium]